jgi:hypothetical protein
MTRTIVVLSGTTTTFDDSLTEAEAAELTRPKPAWLWRPEWFLPAKPAEIRDEGTALVLTTTTGHPRRVIRLEKATGCLLGFTDTDATGKITRVVECRDWKKVSGIRLPGSVTERVTGTAGGFDRVLEFVGAEVNAAIPEATFALP